MSVPLPPDVDPARARVILLGAESFPLIDAARAKRKLAPLSKEAFRNSAGEFAKYLCDPHPPDSASPTRRLRS